VFGFIEKLFIFSGTLSYLFNIVKIFLLISVFSCVWKCNIPAISPSSPVTGGRWFKWRVTKFAIIVSAPKLERIITKISIHCQTCTENYFYQMQTDSKFIGGFSSINGFDSMNGWIRLSNSYELTIQFSPKVRYGYISSKWYIYYCIKFDILADINWYSLYFIEWIPCLILFI